MELMLTRFKGLKVIPCQTPCYPNKRCTVMHCAKHYQGCTQHKRILLIKTVSFFGRK